MLYFYCSDVVYWNVEFEWYFVWVYGVGYWELDEGMLVILELGVKVVGMKVVFWLESYFVFNFGVIVDVFWCGFI